MNPILLPLSQAAAVPSSRTWFDNPAIQNKLGYALVETLAMTFVSGAITVILGLLLGLALVSTGKRGQFRNPALYWVLSQIVNIGRSMPFIILMVALIPITRMLVGTSLGWQAACVPLTIRGITGVALAFGPLQHARTAGAGCPSGMPCTAPAATAFGAGYRRLFFCFGAGRAAYMAMNKRGRKSGSSVSCTRSMAFAPR